MFNTTRFSNFIVYININSRPQIAQKYRSSNEYYLKHSRTQQHHSNPGIISLTSQRNLKMSLFTSIALVGASGHLGAVTLKHLIATSRFNITIVTRSDSTATFPNDDNVIIRKGDYDDITFLESSFKGKDAVVLCLSTGAVPVVELQLIEAAAKAGVKWGM